MFTACTYMLVGLLIKKKPSLHNSYIQLLVSFDMQYIDGYV